MLTSILGNQEKSKEKGNKMKVKEESENAKERNRMIRKETHEPEGKTIMKIYVSRKLSL